MKRILVSIYFLILTGIVTGQEVEVILEFNVADATGVDEVEILDVTPDRLVIAVRSNDFSLNNGYSFQNEEANEVILFCDASLNVIWSKSFKTTIVHDAIIGSEGIYLYLESIEAIEVIEDDLSFEKSAVITKVDFNGDFIWSQEYGGIQRIASSGRSLALDGGENLILATGLWNYVHPSSPDTLVFNDEICYCDALAFDFSDCVTTLKWDSDGNELAYHILSSQGPSRALDVGADAFGNYYVSGRQDISPSSPIFAGTEIDGGEFLLAFDSNDSQKWVYHRSDQLESYNSERIGFIHADEEHVYLDIEHSSNEVVTDGQSILLNQPIDGQLSYQTIHVIESNSGDLESIDLIGHYTGYSHIRIDEVDNFYTFGSPYLGFEHDFSPYAHSPNSGDRVVTSKQILGAYYEPVIIEADALNRIDCYFNGRYYLELARSQGFIDFMLNDEEFNTQASNIIIILDNNSSIEGKERATNDITILPNPIDDKVLNIESTFPIKYVTILNQQGQQVQSIQGFNRIKLQEELMLSPGLYFVVVEGEEYDQRIAKQLIVH